jgi:hypothetical protein
MIYVLYTANYNKFRLAGYPVCYDIYSVIFWGF